MFWLVWGFNAYLVVYLRSAKWVSSLFSAFLFFKKISLSVIEQMLINKVKTSQKSLKLIFKSFGGLILFVLAFLVLA